MNDFPADGIRGVIFDMDGTLLTAFGVSGPPLVT